MADPRIDRIAARQAAQTAATRLTVTPLRADPVGAGSALSAESVTATATVPSVIVRIDSTIPMSPVNATGAVLTASVATSNAMQKVFMNGQWKTIGSRQAYINGSWKSF